MNVGVLALSAGSLIVNANGSTQTLNLSGSGVLDGSGAVGVTSALNWTAGTMQGTGTTTVANTATLTMSTSGTKTLSDPRVLVNNGSAVWSGGTVTYPGSTKGGVFNNAGTFDIQTDGNFFPGLINSGTLTKSAGTGVTRLGFNAANDLVNNTGVMNVNSGTLQLTTNGTHTGAFNVAGGATLEFNVGTHTLSNASSLAGAGTVAVTGATVTGSGAMNVGVLALSAGSLVILSRGFWRRRNYALLAVPMLPKKTARSFAAKNAAQDDKRITAGDLDAVLHRRTISHNDPMKRNGEE